MVATSAQVAQTPARSAKTRLLAECLRAVDREELEIAVLYLAGVKRYRADKRVEEADTMDTVRKLFAAQ